MGDIVERLRSNDGSCDWDETIALHEEAADEIERLRLELSATHDMAATLEADVLRLRAERDALRAVYEAASGLCLGTDWNHGTHASKHGYKQKLINAVQAAKAALAARGKE